MPKRRAYTYALRLERYGLLAWAWARVDTARRLVLRITAQGLRRLAWLERSIFSSKDEPGGGSEATRR